MKKTERAAYLTENRKEPSYTQLFPPGILSALELALSDLTYCSPSFKVCIRLLKRNRIIRTYLR